MSSPDTVAATAKAIPQGAIERRRYDVGEIFEMISNEASTKRKEEMLGMCASNNGIKNALMAVMNPDVVFKSQKIPSWEPCGAPIGMAPANLELESTKLVRMLEGHSPEIAGDLYDKMLGDLLSNLHPNESMVVISMIQKKSLGKGITENLVRKVFPDLLPLKSPMVQV